MIDGDPGLLSDPSESSSIVAATRWVEASMLGSLATIVAVMAVAWLGFLLLQGRLPARRGLSVLIGAFVLFGAGQIANGLQTSGSDPVPSRSQPLSPKPLNVPQVRPQAASPAAGFDPYAGAAYSPPR